jgi:hypothetical protein
MEPQAKNTNDQSVVIRNLVSEVEALREKRRNIYSDLPHPAGKRFTQEELADSCCPSYKNLLYGYTRRLPSRSQIIEIGNYLECSQSERNDLLLAAQYAPEQVELNNAQFASLLDQAKHLIQMLPVPACVNASQDRNIGANDLFLRMIGVDSYEGLASSPWTGLGTCFDKRLPFRERMKATPEIWESSALTTIFLFRQHNQLFRNEHWYREHIASLHGLPDFTAYWNSTFSASYSPAQAVYTLAAGTEGRLIRLRPWISTLSATPYPFVFMLVPDDEAARDFFHTVGDVSIEDFGQDAMKRSTLSNSLTTAFATRQYRAADCATADDSDSVAGPL